MHLVVEIVSSTSTVNFVNYELIQKESNTQEVLSNLEQSKTLI